MAPVIKQIKKYRRLKINEDSAGSARPPQNYSHGEIMVIIGALMMAMLLAALDQTIVSTALPRIASDLHGLSKLSWVATAYLLTSAIVTPIFGKLGDLYGRKKLFLMTIVLFLIGSALCGLSRSMDQLVFFRGLQGIGGGGLMSLILAIVGDVIPPRMRGRYQGYFGAVFAISSVVGPLLGGFLAGAHTILGITGWRWIFYINLPIGLLALSVVSARLHLPVRRTEHKIDYWGALFLSLAVACLVLVTVWAGVTYTWGSEQIVGLASAVVVLTGLFIYTELRVEEPMIPLSLFKNDIFTVSIILSLLSGIAMFASVLYIPVYQQVVRGYSPTKSGLLMIPLVFGLMSASIISGRTITKTGRYKFFPLAGTLTMTLGLWLFSHVTLTTSQITLSIWMIILGAGLGSFMQVATLAIQNSVDPKHLGTATSSATFFRSMGSALGGAFFGTVLISRLTHHIVELLPNFSGGSAVVSSSLSGGAQALAHAPEFVRHDVLLAFSQSFHDMFLLAMPFALAAFITALFLREAPLRTHRAPAAPQAHQSAELS